MAWSGGQFTRANGDTGWGDDAAALIGIEAGRHDTQDNDFKTGINATLTKDGTNTPTANLPMNTFKHTGVGLAVASTDYTRYDQAVRVDGTNTPTANLPMGGFKHTNVAIATASTDYARYDQALALIPTGTIWQYAATSAPTGWLTCDGTAVSRATYATLFALVATTYGVGDGSTTFNLPDLQRRTPIGKGAADSLGNSDGVAAGSRALTHTHTTPAHYHGMGTGATLNITSSGAALSGIETSTHVHSGTTGAGTAHTHTNTISAFSPNGTTNGTRVANTNLSTNQTNNTTACVIDSESAHTHAFVTGNQSGNHQHNVPAHTHASTDVAGLIGLVTGGVNGNAAMTSGSNNNTNYLVLQYIIKT